MFIGQIRALPIYRFFSFRLAPGSTRQTIAGIERKWHDSFPDAPFDYAFMDETLQRLYQTELQLQRAAYVATGLALLIVLLGVVGLVSLSVSRRTKEVGIRKVFGSIGAGHCWVVSSGIRLDLIGCQCYCLAHSLLGCYGLARRLCLSHYRNRLAVCAGWCGACSVNWACCGLTGDESRPDESGEEFAE